MIQEEEVGRKRHQIYCPECNAPFFDISSLIEHAMQNTCTITVERLAAVGIDQEHLPNEMKMSPPNTPDPRNR